MAEVVGSNPIGSTGGAVQARLIAWMGEGSGMVCCVL
jgi:hypothetical protein